MAEDDGVNAYLRDQMRSILRDEEAPTRAESLRRMSEGYAANAAEREQVEREVAEGRGESEPSELEPIERIGAGLREQRDRRELRQEIQRRRREEATPDE